MVVREDQGAAGKRVTVRRKSKGGHLLVGKEGAHGILIGDSNLDRRAVVEAFVLL